MIAEAGPDHRAALDSILTAGIDQAMFPLSNLRAHGLGQGGFPSDHPHATRYWIIDGTSVVALTRGGMLLSLLATGCDLAGLPAALKGQTVQGAAGPAASTRPVLGALGLSTTPARLDEDEPGFALDLSQLRLPPHPDATLIPARAADRDLLIAWRAAATIETQGMPPDQAHDHAAEDVDGCLAKDSHRILHHHGQPVALTGFNVRLPEIVQVGGVYTPPALRNRGHARTAVALHLAEARAGGASRAVLFAATPAATRAYLAIGFQPAAHFSLVLFCDPVTL
ncbi:GNAT family N-acetyltransferase [Tabrizicola sp.]|uniref:GNAT family N-acetyltransferase n=1 Tax=Tabrizicola sp. TaxID=2005166 RepID=UPI0035AFC61B